MIRKHITMRDNKVAFDLEGVLLSIQQDVQEIKEELGGKADRTELENLRRTVEDVRIHGSGQAQQALTDLTVVRAQITKLELDQASKKAVDDTVRQLAEQGRSIRFFWIGLIATVLIGLFGNIVALAALAIHFLGK